MLVDAVEIERLPIYEKLALGDSHCSNPDREGVEVGVRHSSCHSHLGDQCAGQGHPGRLSLILPHRKDSSHA